MTDACENITFPQRETLVPRYSSFNVIVLMHAIHNVGFESTIVLMEAGDDVNIKGYMGFTPLHWGCQIKVTLNV